MQPRRKLAFRLVTLIAALASALAAAELLLRKRNAEVAAKEFLDPSLVQYDATLGWRLRPLASARHAHADYDVTYTIDSSGRRLDPNFREGPPLAVVLGDSFTFGFGVSNEATFVSQLNSDAQAFANFAVPGYSTDQELLLLEADVAALKPQRIVVVVCLINDVFDNALPFPLQAPHAKPFFELEATNLVLRNVPVPQEQRNPGAGLTSVVPGGRTTPLHSLLLGRALIDAAGIGPGAEEFRRRFAPDLELFRAIALRMREACSGMDAELTVVLMPGASCVKAPRSLSARYQDVLREEIARLLGAERIRVIDLTPGLRSAHEHGAAHLFFKRDGHLADGGHRAVASLLATELE